MSRGQRKQVIYCLEHEFSLTPLRADVYLKQTAILSYCKGKIQTKCKGHQKKNQNQENCSCCPIFNKDWNHATNSFILPQEQQNFIENSQKLKLEHDCRVCDYNDQKSKMLVPKPKTRYSYCNVCRASYDDYLQHIQNQSHKANVSKSKFTNFIRDLEKKYQGKDKKRKVQSKTTETLSTTFYNIPQSQINIGELGKPTKKTKLSKEGLNQVRTQDPSVIASIPIPHFSSNLFYSPMPYQMYAGVSQQLQMIPTIGPNFAQMHPMNYHMSSMMMGNPCFCWNPYQTFYPTLNNINYNQFKPLVIDLQQKQD